MNSLFFQERLHQNTRYDLAVKADTFALLQNNLLMLQKLETVNLSLCKFILPAILFIDLTYY